MRSKAHSCRSFVHGCGGCMAATTRVVYPLTTQEDVDSRYEYDWAVLRVALQKTAPRYGPFELHQSTPCRRSAWRRSC
jgi:hypothetical protein